jgi:hypothetical protein
MPFDRLVYYSDVVYSTNNVDPLSDIIKLGNDRLAANPSESTNERLIGSHLVCFWDRISHPSYRYPISYESSECEM